MLVHATAGSVGLQDGQLYQGQPAPRAYEIHDGEVLDIESGLIWQRCSVGQAWVSAKGCEGQVETFTFDNAQQNAYGHWRLPTQFELAKLIDHGRAFQDMPPTIDVDVFPNMDPKNLWYWTSVSDGPFVAWYASFFDGRFSLDDRKFSYAVRLVQDKQ
jgi:hypothetical protein